MLADGYSVESIEKIDPLVEFLLVNGSTHTKGWRIRLCIVQDLF